MQGRFGALLAAAGCAAAFAPSAHAEAPDQVQAWRFRVEHVLGTSLDLVAVSADRGSARRAADAALAEIDRLDAILSGWRDDSELSRLNHVRSMAVSPELFEVLAACEGWRAATGGAFDARQGAVFALRRAGGDERDVAQLWDAVARVDAGFDPATRTVFRPKAVVFAPEALAKGHVIDKALDAARAAAPDVAGLMIDVGGDLRCWGQGPGGGAWTIGIEGPEARLRAGGLAFATSGPRDEGFDHIVGGDGRRRATAAAPTAAEADALATALCALPAADGLALAERLPGMEARIVEDGAVHATSGWTRLTLDAAAPPPRLIRIAAAAPGPATAGAPWPAKFALAIDYELPRKGARAYSPYVAIWITDENSKLVRGLTMLGDKLDYVSENYIWWRRYGRSHPQIVAAISRPTHRPGKYTVVWDGKDDMGMAVPQGRYTVHVEATREDGLHSYQAMDMMLGADPVQAAGAMGDELGPSTVRYGPR